MIMSSISQERHEMGEAPLSMFKRVVTILSRRWILSVCLVLCISTVSNTCWARLFFTGPNPFFSSSHFPQDGLLFEGSGSFAFIDHYPRGWFGNLDDPKKLPSPNYTMTSQSLHLSNPQSDFSLHGTWTQNKTELVPYYFQSHGFHIQSLLSYTLEDLYMKADGIARSYDDTLGWEQVPFEALLERQNKQYGTGIAVAKQLGSVPFGIRVTIDRSKWGEPNGYLQKSVNGAEEIYNRYTWGWTTQQSCNHILASHANIDAWYQDGYSMATSWLINTVVGATIKEHKLALRYRHFSQDADEYEYDSDRDGYVRDGDWTERTSKHLLRGYGLFKILKLGQADLYLLGFAETQRSWINYVGAGDAERLDCIYEKKADFEIVPVVASSLGKGFLRAGFDILWGWASLSNTDVWGRQRVYRESYPYTGWTPDWEKPGYANSFFIANLSEVDVEYPILQRPEIVLRLELFRMQQWTYTTGYFGENESSNGGYVFEENAVRQDKRKETWMGGSLGMWTGFGTVFAGFFVDLPITYHSVLDTKVIDNDEGETFSDSRSNFPAVQDPTRLRVIIGKRW